jgi:L-lactate dehydrogenase complex protein LldE
VLVALFVTCLVDQLVPDVGEDTVAVLERAGCTVEFPKAQTCCGQPALTAGDPASASRLARHFVEVFEPYEAIVAPSGSCVAMVRHWYPRVLDGEWKARAVAVGAHTYELTQFLVDVLDRTDIAIDSPARVTVHDACHGLRHLGVRDQPRQLLEAGGAEVVEMTEPETCCGFGGVFGVTHGEVATYLADRKLADAGHTGADCVVACDAACLLHLAGRRRRTGAGPAPRHVASVLNGSPNR